MIILYLLAIKHHRTYWLTRFANVTPWQALPILETLLVNADHHHHHHHHHRLPLYDYLLRLVVLSIDIYRGWNQRGKWLYSMQTIIEIYWSNTSLLSAAAAIFRWKYTHSTSCVLRYLLGGFRYDSSGDCNILDHSKQYTCLVCWWFSQQFR